MIRFCLALASVAFWPALPAPSVTVVLLFMALLLRLHPYGRPLWPLLLGLVWGIGWGQWQLAHRLPVELEGQTLSVAVTVVGLPLSRDDYCRFDAHVDHWPQPAASAPRLLRLSWYQCQRLPLPGERWQFDLRLKRPHGYRNPAGPDRDLSLLSAGIDATGYVYRADVDAYRGQARLQGRWDRWRWQLADQLLSLDSERGALLAALLLGDRRGLSQAQWQRLRDTGTLHLFVVSGMHIGLVALLVYGAMVRIGRLQPRLRLHYRQQTALVSALLVAGLYAALSGWGLPAQRAWVMVAVLLYGWVSWRSRSNAQRLWMAATAVLLLDPLALRSAGFWLSFAAAGCLLYAFGGRGGAKTSPLQSMLWAQWAAFLGIGPWLLLAFHQLSLWSPLINLIAIPLVTLLLLPLALLALLAYLLGMGVEPLSWVGVAMGWFDMALAQAGALAYLWTPGGVSLPGVLLASLGSLLMLAPRALPGRWLGVVLWMPLLWPAADTPAPASARLTVFDVGQGSAVLVETAGHRLLFDSGPRFRSGFAAAEVTVLPYLRRQGIEHLDRVMITHDDSDHSGGLAAVRKAFGVGELFSGEAPLTGGLPCRAGQYWRWDGVLFEVLYPPASSSRLSGNHASCVLRISSGMRAALLTGDIERIDEAALVATHGQMLKSDWLLVPHHGSRSSSTPAFVDAVSASTAVFSSGYRNRFGHPHKTVQARLRDRGATLFNTAEKGMLQWRLSADGLVRLDPWPGLQFHYWWD
ncbi:DNA internalization-related competence protein ComEC/Rec2 [Motiliproteus sediminis]|uniref:DNA internalization-related competence protein ComEC/Rec2 n=1 Tax=Motiliproteus sediminis TaxID=1468178 RepID=UPI001AEFC55C|nr:DNA internalization-related competence protein ComEC/Rec2 [Motiliproteus sediminis]